MRLHRFGHVRPPVGQVRFAGVGLAMLGTVGLGLGLVVAPACGGGGSTGENAVHLQGAAAAKVTLDVAGGSVAPDCGGGGATGDN
jgi:hypothetical protein